MTFEKPILILLMLSSCLVCADTAKNNVVNNHNNLQLTENSLTITLIGRALLNANNSEGAAEIVAFQKSKKWVYTINSSLPSAVVEIIDISRLTFFSELTTTKEGVVNKSNLSTKLTLNIHQTTGLVGDVNSIAVDDNNELLAVAIASGIAGVNGHIAFFDISRATPRFIKNVEVGDLPDNVVFNQDGSKIIVANEGEPSPDYLIDPEGSIAIIDIDNGVPKNKATIITFTLFNAKQAELESQGVKFSNPSGKTIKGKLRYYSVAQDIEPEYIAVSADNQFAFVSLQENNAIAIVDLTTNLLQVKGLGYKNWSNNLIDVSDKDGGLNLQTYEKLYSMYQPDTIASYQWRGANYIVSANEGDSRKYKAFERIAKRNVGKSECSLNFPAGNYIWAKGKEQCIAYTDVVRVKDLKRYGQVSTELDNYIAKHGGNKGLGRLKVTHVLGKNTNNQYDSLFTFGARSFSIWDQNGSLVFDSGDEIVRITASIHGQAFNNNENQNSGDSRSDAKGTEPEALTIGSIGSQVFAFVGLERMSGILVYNITNPYNVIFTDYFYNRGVDEGEEISGDLGPEGMTFINAQNSPTGKALLVIGNEISGSVAIWEISEG